MNRLGRGSNGAGNPGTLSLGGIAAQARLGVMPPSPAEGTRNPTPGLSSLDWMAWAEMPTAASSWQHAAWWDTRTEHKGTLRVPAGCTGSEFILGTEGTRSMNQHLAGCHRQGVVDHAHLVWSQLKSGRAARGGAGRSSQRVSHRLNRW
jgi:hypothetical protein